MNFLFGLSTSSRYTARYELPSSGSFTMQLENNNASACWKERYILAALTFEIFITEQHRQKKMLRGYRMQQTQTSVETEDS